ncbi:fertility inhibition domain protein [Escherichia coli 7-233-03_S3_C3]|nr:fertility inhibition domain protein [Escherichia coli 7-233-03_S3_C3]
MFDGDTPRLLACGIRDVLLEDVAQRNIPKRLDKIRRQNRIKAELQ